MNEREFIPQYTPSLGHAEARAVTHYMESGGWLTEFRKTEEFAERIAALAGASHCSIMTNGTVSLTAAIVALGIGRGDDVIVPDYTMVATPNSVLLAGATPVFCDIQRSSLCLDLDRVRAMITERTAAVMLVSINGRFPSNTQALLDYCSEQGIHVIEDAAQSLGSRFGGTHAGRLGAIGSFSFSMPKIITTGQGGALITDDDELHRRITRIRDFGRDTSGNDDYKSVGWNFKFTDLQAVIGLEQLKKLPHRVQRKKSIYQEYAHRLERIDGIQLIETNLDDTAPWLVDVLAQDRDSLAAFLRDQGIGSRAFYPALHSCPAYSLEGDFPVASEVSRNGLWLPSSMEITTEQIERVCATVSAFYALGA